MIDSEFPKISIVTPSFNDAKFIETTIVSLLQQNYPNLEYIIIDGGSTDGTLDIIKKYEDLITYWESGADKGMYHAIQKGFDRSTGSVMGWLNSDDMHHTRSLYTIGQIFYDCKQISWLQGTPNIVDEENRIVYAGQRPEVDRLFFYQKKHVKTGTFIQQESTFWTRDLWDKAGGYVSLDYSYAGDFELWIRFFQHASLYNVPALIGAFRKSRKDQASRKYFQQYLAATFKALDDHPLPRHEKSLLKNLNYIDAMENRLVKANWLKQRIKLKDKSVIKNQIYFDELTQTFKMK